MGLLQSLGLAGASKTVRRLLRRPSHYSSNTTASPHLLSQDAQVQAVQAPDQATSDVSLPMKNSQNIGNENSPHASQDPPKMYPLDTSALAMSTQMVGVSTDRQSEDEQSNSTEGNKENQRPTGGGLTQKLADLSLVLSNGPGLKPQKTSSQSIYLSDDPAIQAEKARHQRFTEEALDMARLALRTNETPVGCVLVHEDMVIAKGMNATNVTRNGTRHAEFMALAALLSHPPKDGPRTTRLLSTGSNPLIAHNSDSGSISSIESDKSEGNADGSKGHLYPYGQKLHPDSIVDQDILHECVLYVTVEPCVMCASLLRQFGIKKVYFGAVNDKFGGTGGVFSIHANSDPDASASRPRSVSRQPPPLVGAAGTLGESFPVGGGDGGNVEKGYEIEGGWGRDEAVGLLRRFYVQENGRAPVPRKKEGRAARLMAIMDRTGPDAVCAALLSADGVLNMEKLPASVTSGESEYLIDCDNLMGSGVNRKPGNIESASEGTESDKENAPIPG